jgi:hypothetical protein
MKVHRSANVYIAHSVPICQAEFLVASEIGQDSFDAPADHGLLACVDERHAPRLSRRVMHLHLVVLHVERHVRHMKEVIIEVLLDDVALVSEANHDAMARFSSRAK